MEKPNFIIILTDDLGYGDCSCYGQREWATPAIDRLAAEGVRFTDFYTTSPVCSPARASLLTGLHAGHLPIRQLTDPFVPDDLPTIPKRLRTQGYVSACIGKYGVGSGQPDVDPIRKGFDYHYGYNCMRHAHNYFPPFLRENGLKVPLRNQPPAGDQLQWETGVGVAEVKVDYSPDFIEARALAFIHDCAGRPFFLHYCPTMPHANNEGGESPDGMEVDTYGEFQDREWKVNEKGFARMVQRIDISVGRIMDALKSTGQDRNTWVIFTSDNGPHNEGGHAVTRFNSAGGFRGYKRSLHEGGIRVPFIVRAPAAAGGGRVSSHLGYFPDLLPTLCDLAGAGMEGVETDGCSMRALLNPCEGTQQAAHAYLYFEYQQQRAVRRGNWKYVRSETEGERLYDLATDRHEDRDQKEEQPALLAELRACLERAHRDYQPVEAPVSYAPPGPAGAGTGLSPTAR